MKLLPVVILILLILPLPASPQTLKSMDAKSYAVLLHKAHQCYKNKEYKQALEFYQASYEAEPLYSTLYNIAVCHGKLEQWEESLNVFIRLLPDPSEVNLITYNTAIVYKKIGNAEKALRIFQDIAERSEDKELVRLAVSQIERMTNPSATMTRIDSSDSLWHGSFDIGYGVDDDVVAPDDETSIPASENYLEALATVGWIDHSRSRNRWTMDAVYYGSHYPRLEDYDLSLIGVGGKKYFPLPLSSRGVFFLGVNYNHLLFGGDAFLSNQNFIIGSNFYIAKSTNLSVEFCHKRIDDDDSIYMYLAGYSNCVDISWMQGDKRSRWKIKLRYIADRLNDRYTETSFNSYSADRYELLAGKSWRLKNWSLNLYAKYRVSDYRDMNILDNQATAKRSDNRLVLTADTGYEIYKNWSLIAKINWSNNQSNIDPYDYERNQVLGGIRYQF